MLRIKDQTKQVEKAKKRKAKFMETVYCKEYAVLELDRR